MTPDPFSRLEAVFSAHNGFSLYRDERSDLTGVEILPVERWPEATQELKMWLENCPDEYDPANLRKGIAFGYIPNAADGFVISLDGEHAGKIFYFKHSDAYMPSYASDFDEFVLKITDRPVALLTEVLGDYYRCAYNGRSVWVPDSIVEGRNSVWVEMGSGRNGVRRVEMGSGVFRMTPDPFSRPFRMTPDPFSRPRPLLAPPDPFSRPPVMPTTTCHPG